MDKILEYGDAINIIQADERNRISERIDVPLFDYEAYHEAILNAFIHNKWLTLNGPQISIFTDRIEILSHGGLALDQDVDGFYSGASIPVNEILASIFLQLRISERSGRGVPKIVSKYGKDAIKIEKNRIVVTIPFNKINVNSFVLFAHCAVYLSIILLSTPSFILYSLEYVIALNLSTSLTPGILVIAFTRAPPVHDSIVLMVLLFFISNSTTLFIISSFEI